MSFKLGVDKIQEVLMLALVLVLSVAVFYSNIELFYKVIVSVLVLGIILLIGLASQTATQKEGTHF